MKKSKIVIFCFSLLLITLFSCKDDNECLHNDDETEEVIKQFYNSKPVWENYDSFLKSVQMKERKDSK